MKLFGWKGAAVAPRPVLSRANIVGGAVLGEWPNNYEAQVRAAVIANPVAQRAVRLVSEACGASAAENAEALALVRHVSAGQSLVETLALHLLLHGNGYVQILPDSEGEPSELFALRPERVCVELDNNGWPVAYAYRVLDRVTRLWAEDGRGCAAIMHLKAINPLDDHAGLASDGTATALAAGSYSTDITGDGDGWVRVSQPRSETRLELDIVAGIAADWPSLPDSLRQGIVRLAAHLFTERESSDPPPTIVTALWRPWRRIRLA